MTPRTIEVSVRSKSHARVQTTVKRGRKTVLYSSDEMEVSENRHEVFRCEMTPVRKTDKNNRQTRNLSEAIVVETPSVRSKSPEVNEVEEAIEQIKRSVLLLQAPINSTRFSAIQNSVVHFEADDISSILSVEEFCSHTPSPNLPVTKPPSSKKIPIPINEETKRVSKPRRKRKLFNPNLTPKEVEHDEKSEVSQIAPTPKLPDDPSPVPVVKIGSDDFFESSLKISQKPKISQNIPNASQQIRERSKSLRTFVGTGLDKDSRTLLKTCVKQLSRTSKSQKSEIQAFINKRATHLIMQEPYTKTQKLLLAILHGIWILNVDYLKACLDNKMWLPEESYEVKNFLPGISLSRAEREIFGTSYKMRLFSSMKIYVCPQLSAGAEEIREFIELADGKLVDTPDEAKYQIRDEVCENFGMDVQVAVGWITDSIGAGHCKCVSKYLLGRRFYSQSCSTQM